MLLIPRSPAQDAPVLTAEAPPARLQGGLADGGESLSPFANVLQAAQPETAENQLSSSDSSALLEVAQAAVGAQEGVPIAAGLASADDIVSSLPVTGMALDTAAGEAVDGAVEAALETVMTIPATALSADVDGQALPAGGNPLPMPGALDGEGSAEPLMRSASLAPVAAAGTAGQLAAELSETGADPRPLRLEASPVASIAAAEGRVTGLAEPGGPRLQGADGGVLAPADLRPVGTSVAEDAAEPLTKTQPSAVAHAGAVLGRDALAGIREGAAESARAGTATVMPEPGATQASPETLRRGMQSTLTRADGTVDAAALRDLSATRGLPETGLMTSARAELPGVSPNLNPGMSAESLFDGEFSLARPVALSAAAAPGTASLTTPTTAGSTLLTSTIDLPVGDRAWGDALGQRVTMLAGQRISNAEIRLNPVELGPVRVEIRVEDNVAQVNFSATHAATRDAIEQAMPRLRELLTSEGLTLADSNVSDEGVRQGRDEQATAGRGNSAATATDEQADADEGDGAVRATASRHDGLVDTFA